MQPASFEHDFGDLLGTEGAISVRMHHCASRHEKSVLPISGLDVGGEGAGGEANVEGDEIAWMAGSGNVNMRLGRRE